jgi:thiol-disulfide isomerase/thioredoxin
MLKRILLLTQLSLLSLLAVLPNLSAQGGRGGKPSQALRQVAEQQRKLMEEHERNVERSMGRSSISSGASSGSGAAPVFAPDTDEMDEALIRFAAERANGFKISDWKGEELYSLASLYQTGEQFASARDAYRAYLSENPGSRTAPSARVGLVRALIETERLEEAEKLLAGMELTFVEGPSVTFARIGLHKDLAMAMRDRGIYERAAELAKRGYLLADVFALSRRAGPNLIETAERNQIIMAALAVASYERAGRKKEAADLNKLALDFDFNRQPELRSVYENELAAARLIGTLAPELDVSRWIEGKQGEPKSLSELRGKVVLLDFWAMWCGPCVVAFPRLREFQSKYADRGLEIIGVTKLYGRSDTEESLAREQEFKSLQNYKAKHQLTYPFAVGKMDDVTNEERYGLAGMPTIILIDRRGVVRHVKRGVGEYRKLERRIEKLIGEK